MMHNSPAYAFIAAKRRGIGSLADLKRKKISVREPDGIDTRFVRALIRGYRFVNQRYADTKKILKQSGYELDKDMDAALWEGKYHMFERIPQDGNVNEAGLQPVIDKEKEAGKLRIREFEKILGMAIRVRC